MNIKNMLSPNIRCKLEFQVASYLIVYFTLTENECNGKQSDERWRTKIHLTMDRGKQQ